MSIGVSLDNTRKWIQWMYNGWTGERVNTVFWIHWEALDLFQASSVRSLIIQVLCVG